MKQIKENEKLTTIILEDGDILNICKMEKKKITITIKCINNTFHINEITYKELKNLSNEKQALQALNQYLNNQK